MSVRGRGECCGGRGECKGEVVDVRVGYILGEGVC